MQSNSMWMKVWNIIYPFVMFEALICFSIYAARGFIGADSSSYMICQIIGTVITLPFIFFSFYRADQKIGVTNSMKNHREEAKKVNKKNWPIAVNILFIVFLSAIISIAMNNILLMLPIAEASEDFAAANANFFGSTVVIEFIGAALLTPILEEMVFRGVIFSRLKFFFPGKKYMAVLLSALCFSLIHLNVVQFIYAFLFGIVLALMMEKSGHLYGAVLGHAVANGISVFRTEFGWLQALGDKSAFAWGVSIILLVIGVMLFFVYMLGGKES